MKTKTILFLFLLISGMVSAQVKRVAILETVDKENKVSYANKLILRANLSKAITNTAGYEAYDRTDIDAIMGEQNFQRTGLVSNDQIKRLGEMTGANYILVAEAVVVDVKTMFITAKLLDVETARTIMTDNMMMGSTPEDIQEGCASLAEKLFGNVTHQKKTTFLSSVFERKNTPVPIALTSTGTLVRYSKIDQKLMGVKKYSYGDIQMSEQDFRDFLQKHNTQVYLDYTKGTKAIKAGWCLLGSGLVLAFPLGMGIGMSLMYTDDYVVPVVVLCSLCGIGGAAFISSIPLLSVGYYKRNRAFKSIDNSLGNFDFEISLNLQTSQNGIGLALSF